MFVAIEGPNGVGKTTIATLLAESLQSHLDCEVLLTTEPTTSDLGRLLRFADEQVTGLALALGIAADRVLHVEKEIIPAIERGLAVVTDRYVPSSLVLQRIDGLDLHKIWSFNDFLLVPDLTVYLRQDPAVLSQRLATRQSPSRMERIGTSLQEVSLYDDAYAFLEVQGWPQKLIDCGDRGASEIVALIQETIDDMSTTAYK